MWHAPIFPLAPPPYDGQGFGSLPTPVPATGDDTTLYDALVIGGGPAGSTAATLLAMKGRQVLLADKDIHPRFHIGESLLPASKPLFEKLGVWEKLAEIGVPKYAADFVSQYHGRTATFYFGQSLDPGLAFNYQVPRADFDHLLLTNARDKGVVVEEGCKVSEAVRDPATGQWTITATQHGRPRRFTARYLIDASGRETFLGSREKWKVKNPDHASAAMYAHYQGVPRAEGQAGGNIQLYWFAHGWFWEIPLKNGVTSIGAVCWPYYMKSRKVGVEPFFDDTIALAPDLAAKLAGATRLTEVSATGNYSYQCTKLSGPGFCLTGDAYGFIDPLFSTGVLLATEGAALAAERVDQVLSAPAQEAAIMAAHQARIDAAMRDFTWLVYRMPSPIMRDIIMTPDERFATRPPIALESKRAVTSLLSGDVFSETTPRMRKLMRIFKMVYYVDCLKQPRRWWAHRQRRTNYLSA